MNDNFQSKTHETVVDSNRSSNSRSVWTPILAAGLLGVGAFAFYQNSQLDDLRRDVAVSQKDSAALRTTLSNTDTDLQKTLATLQEELAASRTETSTSLKRAQFAAQNAAKKHADTLAGKLRQEETERNQQLTAELTKVKESTDEAATKLSGITTEVGTVKTEVDAAKASIQGTLADLQRVRGDMGVMSGLIATNGKEIQQLRDMGDRNIYEFTINKNAGLQKVGDIQVRLKKADVKRNRYTLEVLADDKRVEKKDKGMNEPVQFYVASKARTPYELVVNSVNKDQVAGYLSTPKVAMSRTGSNGSAQ